MKKYLLLFLAANGWTDSQISAQVQYYDTPYTLYFHEMTYTADFKNCNLSVDLNTAGKRTANLDDVIYETEWEGWLDIKNFPKATFKSTECIKNNDYWTIKGDLTIKDKTKPVQFKVTNEKPYIGEFKINRFDYNLGIEWTDTNGLPETTVIKFSLD